VQAQISIWRAMTIRIIDRPSVTDSENNNQSQLSALKEGRISAMVSTFLSRYAVTEICKDVSELEATRRRDHLTMIIRKATELSSKLAQQNVQVQACFREDLSKEARMELNEPWLLRPHASMHLDDDEYIEDYIIDLVVHSAIMAWGDERGGNHDHHRLWQPAVVFSARRAVVPGRTTANQKHSHDEESQAHSNKESTGGTRAKKACLAQERAASKMVTY
jgi:hypothetical protein